MYSIKLVIHYKIDEVQKVPCEFIPERRSFPLNFVSTSGHLSPGVVGLLYLICDGDVKDNP